MEYMKGIKVYTEGLFRKLSHELDVIHTKLFKVISPQLHTTT